MTDEEKVKAMRLARAIASDISLYNEQKIIKGIEQDNLFEVLSEFGRVLGGGVYFGDCRVVRGAVKSPSHPLLLGLYCNIGGKFAMPGEWTAKTRSGSSALLTGSNPSSSEILDHHDPLNLLVDLGVE